MIKERAFEILQGETLSEIKGGIGDDEMFFTATGGKRYSLYYDHDWCATCDVVDIVGDLQDLIGNPLLMAEEVTNESDVNPEGVTIPEDQDSFTWTFYKLATIKGSVTIRWYGESNGYYSESVSFGEVLDN